MAKDFAKSFYRSKEWRTVSTAYMVSKNYICEICGAPATICHHKIWLNSSNITNPEISLNFDNLQAVCQDCHNNIHMQKNTEAIFDKDGNMIGSKLNASDKAYLSDRVALERMLEKIDPQKPI